MSKKTPYVWRYFIGQEDSAWQMKDEFTFFPPEMVWLRRILHSNPFIEELSWKAEGKEYKLVRRLREEA